ncbi:MAG: DUF4112 domain-containing protein [Cytophagaceae bacterium]
MDKSIDPKDQYDLKWLERISRLMDSQFRFPGTNFKFGLDPIFGLVPFAGDASTFLISGIMVLYMAKYGVSTKVLILMMLNIILDAVVGGIPVIGSIFDFAYKANDKNMRLLKQHYHEGRHQGSGIGILLTIVTVTLLLLILIAYGFWKLFVWLSNTW